MKNLFAFAGKITLLCTLGYITYFVGWVFMPMFVETLTHPLTFEEFSREIEAFADANMLQFMEYYLQIILLLLVTAYLLLVDSKADFLKRYFNFSKRGQTSPGV